MPLGAASRKSRGSSGEPTRRHAVSSGECARERFDCVVASLEAGVSDADAAAESPRGALQQEAAPKRRRCLADAGAHQAVEVKRAEHRPRRQCPPVKALVERFDHGIDNVAQAIRVRLHAPEYAPRRASAHDRNCCGGLRPGNSCDSPAASGRWIAAEVARWLLPM